MAAGGGQEIAARTRPLQLVRGRLVVEVEDGLWQKQLYSLREHIVAGFKREVGPAIVTELEFRVGVPRRQPGRETVPVREAADGIRDPILGRLYEATKKRTTA